MKYMVVFSLFLFLLFSLDADAQCAMCKAVVESNAESSGNTIGMGLNKGILYLMGIPYILLIGVGILLFRRQKKKATLSQ